MPVTPFIWCVWYIFFMWGRGQAASEYLMTYGWAILAVLIAGIVLMESGVVGLGSTTTSSSGLSSLTPILSTCKAGSGIWSSDLGVSCQFINNAGTSIIIRNIDFKLDGQYCGMNYAATKPYPVVPYGVISRDCNEAPETCGPPVCWGSPSDICTSSPVGLPIQKNAQFSLLTTYLGGTDPNNYCSTLRRGQTYTWTLNVTYDISIGGVTATKNELGQIRLMASV